jgi:hypothetical protein
MMFPPTPQVTWCVTNGVSARQLLSLGGSWAVHLYVDGLSSTTTSQNLLANSRSPAGFWYPDESMVQRPPYPMFTDAATFGVDDWTAAVFQGSVYVVRRLSSSTMELSVVGLQPSSGDLNAASAPPPPSSQTLPGSGLVLVPYGAGLVLLALGATGSTVVYTSLSGTTWAPSWSELCSVGGSAAYLSGFGPESGAKPAVIWTQPLSGGSFAIAGAQLP